MSLLVLLLAACTGEDSLSPDDFQSGTCQRAAESVIAVDDAVGRLRAEDSTVEEVAAALEEPQRALRELRPEADEELELRLADLTNAIGFLRIGADTGTFDEAQADAVSRGVQGVVGVCRDDD